MLKHGKCCAFWVNFIGHIALWLMMQPHVKNIQVQWSGRVLAPVSTICQMWLSDSFPGDCNPTFAEKLLKQNVVILPSDSAQCAVCKVYFSAQPNNLKLILNCQKYYPI